MADNQTPPAATDYSGVREYIGARYVPVFANPPEWNDTRGYEPLTIVLHKGNSFTSTPVSYTHLTLPTYGSVTHSPLVSVQILLANASPRCSAMLWA